MEPIASLVLGIHIVGASIWVGGSVALGVVATVLGRSERPGAIDDLAKVARRLGWVMWPALLIAILTGGYNLTWSFPDGVDPRSTAGAWLMVKFGLIVVVLVAGATHSFVLGPRSRRARAAGASTADLAGLARWNRTLGVVTTVASVLVLLAAAFVAGG